MLRKQRRMTSQDVLPYNLVQPEATDKSDLASTMKSSVHGIVWPMAPQHGAGIPEKSTATGWPEAALSKEGHDSPRPGSPTPEANKYNNESREASGSSSVHHSGTVGQVSAGAANQSDVQDALLKNILLLLTGNQFEEAPNCIPSTHPSNHSAQTNSRRVHWIPLMPGPIKKANEPTFLITGSQWGVLGTLDDYIQYERCQSAVEDTMKGKRAFSVDDTLCKENCPNTVHQTHVEKQSADTYSKDLAKHIEEVCRQYIASNPKATFDCRPYQGPKTPPSPNSGAKRPSEHGNIGNSGVHCSRKDSKLKRMKHPCDMEVCTCSASTTKQLHTLLVQLLKEKTEPGCHQQQRAHHNAFPKHTCLDNDEATSCPEHRHQFPQTVCKDLQSHHASTRLMCRSGCSIEHIAHGQNQCHCLMTEISHVPRADRVQYTRSACNCGSSNHSAYDTLAQENSLTVGTPSREDNSRSLRPKLPEIRRSAHMYKPSNEAIRSRSDWASHKKMNVERRSNHCLDKYSKKAVDRRTRSKSPSPPDISADVCRRRPSHNTSQHQENELLDRMLRPKDMRSQNDISPVDMHPQVTPPESSGSRYPPSRHHYRSIPNPSYLHQRRPAQRNNRSNHYRGPPSPYAVACSYNNPVITDSPLSPVASQTGSLDQQPLVKLLQSRSLENSAPCKTRQQSHRSADVSEVSPSTNENPNAFRKQPTRLQSVVNELHKQHSSPSRSDTLLYHEKVAKCNPTTRGIPSSRQTPNWADAPLSSNRTASLVSQSNLICLNASPTTEITTNSPRRSISVSSSTSSGTSDSSSPDSTTDSSSSSSSGSSTEDSSGPIVRQPRRSCSQRSAISTNISVESSSVGGDIVANSNKYTEEDAKTHVNIEKKQMKEHVMPSTDEQREDGKHGSPECSSKNLQRKGLQHQLASSNKQLSDVYKKRDGMSSKEGTDEQTCIYIEKFEDGIEHIDTETNSMTVDDLEGEQDCVQQTITCDTKAVQIQDYKCKEDLSAMTLGSKAEDNEYSIHEPSTSSAFDLKPKCKEDQEAQEPDVDSLDDMSFHSSRLNHACNDSLNLSKPIEWEPSRTLRRCQRNSAKVRHFSIRNQRKRSEEHIMQTSDMESNSHQPLEVTGCIEEEEGEIFSDCTTEIDEGNHGQRNTENVQQGLIGSNAIRERCGSGSVVTHPGDLQLSRRSQGERSHNSHQHAKIVPRTFPINRGRTVAMEMSSKRYTSSERLQPGRYAESDVMDSNRVRTPDAFRRHEKCSNYATRQREDYRNRSVRPTRMGGPIGRGRLSSIHKRRTDLSGRYMSRGRQYSARARQVPHPYMPHNRYAVVYNASSSEYGQRLPEGSDSRFRMVPQTRPNRRSYLPPPLRYQPMATESRRFVEYKNSRLD